VEPKQGERTFGYFKRPVPVLPELSADDKKAIKMLKRISKRMGYSNETCAAVHLVDALAQTIKNPLDEVTKQRLENWRSE
jgi:hypothetical protein